jgi:hypothetical protein
MRDRDDQLEDDPSAMGRGMVYGMLFGFLLWGLIIGFLWYWLSH